MASVTISTKIAADNPTQTQPSVVSEFRSLIRRRLSIVPPI